MSTAAAAPGEGLDTALGRTITTTSSSANPKPNSPSSSENELFFPDSLISVAGESILLTRAFDYVDIIFASSLPFQHSV